jgi:hypothetical protein
MTSEPRRLTISLRSIVSIYSHLDDLVNKIYPYVYLYWTSLIMLIVSFTVIVAWHIGVYRIYVNDVTTLQKVFTILPFLKFLLSLLLFYYITIDEDGKLYD